MATVDVNGVELYYERAGEGERIVLTHGSWTDGRTWHAVAELLVDQFEVVTWDRRGHSRSEDGEGPGSCREDASDLAGLIRHLGDEPVHLVGNSAGGNVVLNLVTMHPDLIRGATVHEPGPMALVEGTDDPHMVRLIEEDKRAIAYVQELIAGGEHRRAAEYFVDEVAVGPGAWNQFPPELRDVLESNARTVDDDLRESFDLDSIDLTALARTPVPLLISTGSQSTGLEAAAARELARLVAGARLEILEGPGHIPHRTHPGDYATMVTRFIDGLSHAPAGATPTRV